MRFIDLFHLGNDRVIGCWDLDGVLIDPGPTTCVTALLEALDGRVPKAILLTHIHLDHAGATGVLVRQWPDVPVYVHEIGAPHMIDPERLIKSATRLYGEEGMERLWGEIAPVPAENIHSLKGGEKVCERFDVYYTPGHASHHVTYFHPESSTAFVGDTAGVRIEPSGYVLAPTPPPDINIEAWRQSLDTIADLSPSALALTHFGRFTNVDEHLSELRASLTKQVQRAQELTQAEFVGVVESEIAAQGSKIATRYSQAMPPEHLWLGLERWLRKQQAD